MPFKKGEIAPGAKVFKKGQSGNPKGRPKKLPHLEELLADVLSDEQNGIEAAKAILMALRKQAIKGNIRAAEVLLDRAYGKAISKTEISGLEGGPIQAKLTPVTFIDDEEDVDEP